MLGQNRKTASQADPSSGDDVPAAGARSPRPRRRPFCEGTRRRLLIGAERYGFSAMKVNAPAS
jgi:hypothetical protein